MRVLGRIAYWILAVALLAVILVSLDYTPGQAILIGLFIAAWKAPKWVKEIGLGALVFAIFWTLSGLYQMFGAIQIAGDAPFSVICGGIRVAMIGTFYGLIVYFISLVIRVIQKPRI